jgi:O-methyltransferase involved in polyketide biosynthesis
LTRSSISSPTATEEEAIVNTLTTARVEMESFDIVDKGRRPDEEVFGFPTVAEQVAPGESLRDDRKETQPCEGIVPDLAGISETMLWSLHNRASETRRPDGVLVDPESVRIRSAINYDFARFFGDPVGSLAARAAEIDRALRSWLKQHPDGCVVSLGEGLETQCRRVDNGRLRWLSVDLPDAIRLRERFLTPTPRFCHIAASALDPVWMDGVDPQSDIFIVAQGLLMYLEPEAVRRLFTSIADRFPAAEIVFDAVPRWFSHLTLWGLNQTPHYRLPAMPWGINRDELESTLRNWLPRVAAVEFLDYRAPRGLPRVLADMTNQIPVARHAVPSLVHVKMANAASLPSMNSNTIAGETSPTSGHEEYRFKDLTTSREAQMTATNGNVSRADTMDRVLALATQNASRSNDIAKATTRIIAKRLALGLAAALDPMHADHVEFARMVPEKVEAFSAAGVVMLNQSGEASRQMMRLASEEVMTTACATIEMTGCSSPAAWAEAQSRFARAWFSRATSSLNTMGMLALTAQAAAMAPIRQTVISNAERLDG